MTLGLYRCSKLTFHIQLPYSFLHFPYVEAAVHYTYHKDYCGNCSWYHSDSNQEVGILTLASSSSQILAHLIKLFHSLVIGPA